MSSVEQKRIHHVNSSADPGSCQNAKPSRHILHERKKNPEGEWKVVRSYEVSTKLGKGGFAKVYLGKEVGTSQQYAIKVVDKSSLEKDSYKEKTFKELLDRRKRLTEIEVKSHILQLINSLAYIHSKGIIHRDLKIANIFLNESMTLKLADFGLSASIKSPSQKRKTICGTPNYIAPEVLKNYGHDFSVDNWAIGVIVYTFLVGKPPFEEKEVENTLKNIKANDYSFPENLLISKEAKDFIQKTLIPDPQQRMTLDQMKQHIFLQQGEFLIPATMPTSTLALPPTTNFLKKYHKDFLSQQQQEQQDNSIKENSNRDVKAFKRTNNFQTEANKQSIRKAGSHSPQDNHQKNDNYQLLHYRSQDNFPKYIQEAKQPRNTAEQSEQQCSNQLGIHQHHDHTNPNNQEISEKEYQIQGESNPIFSDQAPQDICSRATSVSALKRPPLLQRGINQGTSQKLNIKMRSTHKDPKHPLPPEKDLFSRTANTANFQNDQHQLYELTTQNKNICLFDYIDCCSKFGLAYYLNNGTVGILLNNSQIVQIVRNTFEHISKGQDGVFIKQSYQFSSVPETIAQNFRLVLSIKDYFIQKYKDLSPSSKHLLEGDFEQGIYLKKYTSTKKAQLFRFSNNDLQAVFVDKSEIVITSAEKHLYFKDKSPCLRYYSLKERTDLPTEILKRVNYIKDIFQQRTQKENKRNTEQQSNTPKILLNSPMTPVQLVTQDESQTIDLNQRMTMIPEYSNQINNLYTPFDYIMENKTNQNTTTSTNNSGSTQQYSPFEVAIKAPKNQQFISKLSLCGSAKIRASPDTFQPSNLKPTSSLGSSVNSQKIK